MAAAFDEIKDLLKTIKGKIGAHVREFRSFKDQMQVDLEALRGDLNSLNDSVNNLSDCLQEHKQQTAYKLGEVQTSLSSTNSKLDILNATFAQLSTDFQEKMTNISNVECLDAEEFLQTNITQEPENEEENVINNPETYTCGGTGGWRHVVYLDMTDPNTTCPSGWQLTGYSKRTCGRASTGSDTCDSVTFHVNGGSYSRVCGRIKAYQYGATGGFWTLDSSINAAYITGISVTHGHPREHIWTFVAGFSEGNPGDGATCPCYTVGIRIPTFLNDNYFCESGVNEQWNWGRHENTLHINHPLWDGEDCVSSSSCCTFQNPPYFNRQLPIPTTDDIEARICNKFGSTSTRTSDVPIELLEFYVQ